MGTTQTETPPSVDTDQDVTPPRRFSPAAWLAVVAVLAALFGAARADAVERTSAEPAAAEAQSYVIRPGDRLELMVVRLPQLTTEATVSNTGTVSFPLVGVIDAAGLTIDSVRATVRGVLGNKVLDGFDPVQPNAMILLDPEEVDVRVAAYRPVFLDGDVETRGALDYRPGMTVRQAIVEAGGFAVDRYVLEDTGVTEAALRARYSALWIDYAAQSWRIWSLGMELGMEADRPDLAAMPVNQDAAALIGRSEITRLAERENAFQTLIDSLESRKAAAEERLQILEQQLDAERAAEAYDREELKRAEDLLRRGAGTRNRVAEIRRTLLVSSSRFLQVQGQLAAFEAQAQNAAQTLATAKADRRAKLLDELTRVQAEQAQTRTEIEAMAIRIQRKSATLAARPEGMPTSAMARSATVTIYRADSGEILPNAPANAPVFPGDVIEVTLPALQL